MFCHSKISKLNDLQVAEPNDGAVAGLGDTREDAKISTKRRHRAVNLLSSVSTLAIGVAAVLVATPNEAIAQCVEDTSVSGERKVFDCSGSVATQPILSFTASAPPSPPPAPPGPPPPGPPPPPPPPAPDPTEPGITVNLATNFTLVHTSTSSASTIGLGIVSNAGVNLTQAVNGGAITAYGNAVDVKLTTSPTAFTRNIAVTLTGNIRSTQARGVDVGHLTGTGTTGTVSISANNVRGKTDAIYVNNQIGGGTTISVSGPIVGDDNRGVWIKNSGTGTGAVSVTVLDGGSVTGSTQGISVDNNAYGAQITLRSSGSISASTGHGITVKSVGGKIVPTLPSERDDEGNPATKLIGGITIDVTGGALVTGGMKGINAQILTEQSPPPAPAAPTALGNITISAIAVTGGNEAGIYASHLGNGNISITTTRAVATSQYSSSAHAIKAVINSGNLTIDSDGLINGHYSGLDVTSYENNPGTISIDISGAVTGQSAHGIRLLLSGASSASLVTHSTVSGAKSGIYLETKGRQSGQTISIDAKGKISTTSQTYGTDGVDVRHRNLSGGDLTISTVDVSAKRTGISVVGQSLGDIDITSTGLVESTTELPPPATPPASPPPVNAENYHAIRVVANHEVVAGDINVTANEVKSKIGDGINVQVMLPPNATITDSVAGAVSITVNSADGQVHGVFARNIGTGGIAVSSSGTITGNTGEGIDIEDSGTGNIVVNVARVESDTMNAIVASNKGGGSVTVNASGAVAASTSGMVGFHVSNDASGTDLTISANGVTADKYAIFATNDGSGALSITTSGAVTSDTNQAIRAINSGSGDLSVTISGNVTGSVGEGLFLSNKNGGDIIVTATTGAITGTEDKTDEVADTKNGIYALNDASGSKITLTLTNVDGAANGIVVDNRGDSHVNVTANGSIVAGNGHGILATNLNGGAINIVALGAITSNQVGIHATNDANGTVISISAGVITASTNGIHTINSGVGNTSLTITGAITTTSGHGISAESRTSGRLTITGLAGGTITAAEGHGLYAKNSNGNSIIINMSSAITSVSENSSHGVLVINESSGVNANVTLGAVTASTSGIVVTNKGTGGLSLTATGTVTGNGGHAIVATQDGNGALAITTAEVDGSGRGIMATNSGSQGAVLTSTGSVTADGDLGVFLRDEGLGGVTISVTAVTASGGTAVTAHNLDGGALNIAATGAITGGGSGAIGIVAVNDSAGSDIIISTVGVSGQDEGINVDNKGTGEVTITASGSVRASTGSADGGGTGILVRHEGTKAVSISTAGEVSGTKTGVDVVSSGAGAISVVAGGRVVGGINEGIKLSGSVNTGDMAVRSRKVEGATHGIWAKSTSDGQVSITSTGDVIGIANHGIYAYAGQNGGIVTVVVNRDNDEAPTPSTEPNGSATPAITEIRGSASGIFARGRGSSAVNVTVAGVEVSATHSDSPGIRAYSDGSGDVNVTIGEHLFQQSGSPDALHPAKVVGGASGVAIDTGTSSAATGGTTTIVLTKNTNGSVGTASATAIRNNAGKSIITLNAGATIDGNVELGGGVDVLNFAGGLANGVLDGGTDAGNTNTSVDVINFTTGTTTLNSSNLRNWERVTLARGATMLVAGNQRIEANLENAGLVSFRNAQPTDRLYVGGNFAGGATSVISIDVDFVNNRTDTITVNGNVTGTTMIDIIDVSPAGEGVSLRDIRIVGVSGSASQDAFKINNDTILAQGSVAYKLGFRQTTSGRDFFLQVSDETILDYQAILIATPIAFFDAFGRAPSFVQRRAGRLPWIEGGGIGNRFWSRTSYNGHEYGIIADKNGEYQSTNRGMQFGMDLYRQDFINGSWTVGFTGQIGDLNVDSTAAGGTGTVDSESFGVGGTATWIATDNSYVDLQVQYNIVEAKMATVRTGAINNAIESRAWFVSAEIGRQVDYSEGLIVHPQAQITLSQVEGDDFRNSSGLLSLAFDNNTAVTARIGVAAEFKATSGKGYVTANLFYDSLDRWEATASNVRVSDETNPMKFEIGLGSALSLSRNLDFFVQGSHRMGVGSGGDEEQSTFISSGFQFSW